MGDVPERIWLQWHGDGDPELETGEVSVADVTWEREKIFKHDIEYARVHGKGQAECEWAVTDDKRAWTTDCGNAVLSTMKTSGKFCPFCEGQIK